MYALVYQELKTCISAGGFFYEDLNTGIGQKVTVHDTLLRDYRTLTHTAYRHTLAPSAISFASCGETNIFEVTNLKIIETKSAGRKVPDF